MNRKIIGILVCMILFLTFVPSLNAEDKTGDPNLDDPVAIISPSSYTGFEGDSVTFDGSSSYDPDWHGHIAAYLWELNSGSGYISISTASSATITFDEDGYYTLRLTVWDSGDEFGNSPIKTDSTTASVTIIGNTPPTAGFTYSPLNPTTQETVNFIDTSTMGDATIVGWSWNFGGDGTSTSQHSTHLFSDNGIYSVSLEVTDSNGEIDIKTRIVNVLNIPPLANITEINPNPALYENTISFEGFGTDVDGTIIAYNWSSSLDGLLNTSDSFETDELSIGIHNITFMVQDDDEDWSEPVNETLIVTENLPPNAPTITGVEEGKASKEYQYNFVSVDQEGDDVYYYIDWGDNETEDWLGPYESGQSIDVAHTWDEEGFFVIKAKAKDINGAESDWATLEVEMPKIKTQTMYNDLLDQYQNDTWGGGTFRWAPGKFAQSFKPKYQNLSRVEIVLGKTTEADSGDFIISIHTSLDGPALTSKTIEFNSIPNYIEFEWVEFDFPDIDVIPENTYYILGSPTSFDMEDMVVWPFGTYENYSRGSTWWKGQQDWFNNPTLDQAFKTYGCINCSGQNNPPNKPTITGPTSGKTETEYTYNFSTIDPEGDDVYYWILWFDGCPGVSWDGPYESGEDVIKKYTYSEDGNYTISVKAKDSNGAESEWATLEVSMPKQKSYNQIPRIILWLLERFPFLQPYFSHLI